MSLITVTLLLSILMLMLDRLLGSFQFYNCKFKEETHNHLAFHLTQARALGLNVCISHIYQDMDIELFSKSFHSYQYTITQLVNLLAQYASSLFSGSFYSPGHRIGRVVSCLTTCHLGYTPEIAEAPVQLTYYHNVIVGKAQVFRTI